ncbi:PorP/SprF family type IX secretion system membrane protein [Abyssalbus ytuae]|uniref:Type IX secretion system membrane protein PorP/SprF n=1 Tax=Abyssalbus ytuae TaxID=2926907 RepID=A0A9E7D3G3_9FLAO|nr:type IX secretion system membrane protein PorP/SprF [Abyssalbus ytuae]UOB19283.1 type IX secretion system membrane protein PorP/SprF [Abyssalbus ytuae]
MKKIFYSILALASGMAVTAQEVTLPPTTQYLADNPFLIAPTYAGIGDHMKIRMSGLTQWVGVEDAPDTQSIGSDVRLGNKSGLGLVLYNDRNGNTMQSGAKASFAHHLTIDQYDDHFLSFGISYLVNQFKIKQEAFEEYLATNPDPSINSNRSIINHNFEAGFLYRFNGFYLSFNATNLLNKNEDIFSTFEPNELRSYYIYAGYKYRRRRNSPLELEPSVFYQLFESDGRSSTDINFKARFWDFEDYYWAGISYRFLNDQFGDPLNIGPMVGLKKGNFYFAYSYQVILNEISGFNSGSHMITLGLDVFQGISNCRCTF